MLSHKNTDKESLIHKNAERESFIKLNFKLKRDLFATLN
jgi:hypothetical protein